MKPAFVIYFAILAFAACNTENYTPTMASIATEVEHLEGKPDYLDSPFVTAGNRLYLVGHQNGSFPELGWHLAGEMGGLWDHPVKLLDGFTLRISSRNSNLQLNNAQQFLNLPFANVHIFKADELELEIERWQFIPDNKEAFVVEYLITNNTSSERNIQVEFTASSDLRPTWLGEQTGMRDSEDVAFLREAEHTWVVKDSLNPWTVALASSLTPVKQVESESDYQGAGTAVSSVFEMNLAPGKKMPLRIYIAGSLRSETEAMSTLNDLRDNWPQYLNDKQERYRELTERSKLTIPDKELEKAFRWLKYNCDWLVRTVPGIGTGIGAGIPDYPWWFGVDSEYALQGYMMTGQSDVVYKTIHLIDSISMGVNGNGRIVHEVSTNGAVFNKGNINETPQFASLIRRIYDWNGDPGFAEKYFPTIKKGLEWLENENDTDQNGFPDGFGMMEIHGLDSEMTDVAVYTQKAYEDASYLAKVLKEDSLADSYSNKAAALKTAINNRFWSEEFNSYADFIGTDAQALQLIEDALIRADTLGKPWAIKELEQTKQTILDHPSDKPRPFVLYHNWVVNTPMETGIAPKDKALKALETAKKFTNPFGVFVTGIDRDESAGKDSASFKGSKVFSYTGAVMTLPTGVQAIAENNYGRPDEALDYLERMTRSFSYALPGSIYEVSPDYGMMTQAWNIYSYAVPIISQFFGVNPRAADNTLFLIPQMPSKWDTASLENVVMGNGAINLNYELSEGLMKYNIEHDLKKWTVKIVLPKDKYEEPSLSDGKFEIGSDDENWILTTTENTILLQASTR